MGINVGYMGWVSLNGVNGDLIPFTECSIEIEQKFNVQSHPRAVGPVEYSSGPIRVGGSLTLPLFAMGQASITSLKDYIFGVTPFTIVVHRGLDADGTFRTSQYNQCVVKSATISCSPGGYATCQLDILGISRTYPTTTPGSRYFSSSKTWEMPTIINGLVTFNRTSVENNAYPYIIIENVSGWSITIKRQWNEYWAWNNDTTIMGYPIMDELRPGNITAEGSFDLLQPQGLADKNSLWFDIGQGAGNIYPGNYIEFPKTLIQRAPQPINGPNNRIIQTYEFIVISDGIHGIYGYIAN